MIKFIFMVLTASVVSLNAFADQPDPDGYFKNKTWNLEWQKNKLIAKQVYDGEPISQPNRLNVDMICTGSNKKVNVVENLKYCGIRSISVLGDRVVIHLNDYNSMDPQGYCTTKRKEPEQFIIPKDCGPANK